MKVALYASQLAPAGPTGIHRYVSEIARALFERYPDRYRLIASAEDADPTWLPPGMPLTRLPGPRRALHLAWYLVRRPRIDRFGDADVVHVLYPTFPVPTSAPLVYTFHDIQHVEDPGSYRRKEAMLGRAAVHDAAAHAVRIIAVSAQVAREASTRLGIESSRITVVHHGVAERFRTRPLADAVRAVASRFGLTPRSYLLYVGKVETRKNLSTLLRAMARRGPGAPLVVAGPDGQGASGIMAEIHALGLAADVTMTGHLDTELPALMAGALALVHPSEYESFGLPPLEAMSLGTPVIASRAGALPEVLGDAAILLGPHDVEAWAESLTRLQADGGFASALAEKGRSHASRFTWQRAAEATAAVHEEALSV